MRPLIALTPAMDPEGRTMSRSKRAPGRWIDETLHEAFRFRLEADAIVHEARTNHQHLIIFDNALFGRVMMLDGVVQLSERDEFIYHEMMAHVPLFALGAARRVLIVGGGDGGVLREVLKHDSIEHATLCEIDESVIDLCVNHFPSVSAGAFDDRRTRVVIADGTKFTADTSDRFDAILVDSTDPIGPAKALFTHEFYKSCGRCLSSGGVLVTQNGLPFVQGDELKESIAHFRGLFADAAAFTATTPSYVGGPLAFGWASDERSLRDVPLDVLRDRFEQSGLEPGYYTPQTHVAAFVLPAYIQDLVGPRV